ncbi:MAG TPA: MmcQ/YjbR family DNA-binding protein [Actinomycetota bacterium]
MGIRASTVRAFASTLPEATEIETWETATFRVRNKIFCMFSGEERQLWIKSIDEEQRALIDQDPEAYFAPPYVGSKGWVGAVLAKADGDEIRELITEAWCLTAPKRLVKTFDEARER